jgi:hypothetical protein
MDQNWKELISLPGLMGLILLSEFDGFNITPMARTG